VNLADVAHALIIRPSALAASLESGSPTNAYQTGSVIMHRTLYGASAIILTVSFIGSAYAATFATPPAAPARAYETIADVAAVIGAESTPLRDAPQNNGNVLESLTRGTKVIAKEKDPSGKWVLITVHGKQGYVDRRVLKVGSGG
jgi:hypothetical protein